MVSKKNVQKTEVVSSENIYVMSVEDLQNACDASGIVMKGLKENKGKAYTVIGMLIEFFDIEKTMVEKPYKEWEPRAVNMYSQVNRCLKGLVKDAKVNSKKNGKSTFYWSA